MNYVNKLICCFSVSPDWDRASADHAWVRLLSGSQAVRARRSGLDERRQRQTKSKPSQNGPAHNDGNNNYLFFKLFDSLKLLSKKNIDLNLGSIKENEFSRYF